MPLFSRRPLFISCCLIHSSFVFASGFSLYNEYNGAAVGNFAAGYATEFADPSVGWSNPAGLAFLHQNEALIGGVGVFPSATLSGNARYTTEIPGIPPFTYNEPFNNLKSSENALVPSFHLAHPLGPNTAFGLSLVVPFGLSTNWDRHSAVRYEATYTKFLAIDLSPEIGGRLSDNLTFGMGLDLENASVTFNQILGSPALANDFEYPPNILDSSSVNQGNSFGVGFHAGFLAHFNQLHTRFGLNYQSQVVHTFTGTSTLTGPLADPSLNIFTPELANPNASFKSNYLFSNTIVLPSITTLSFYQDLDPRVTLLFSAVYTGWSSIQQIQLYNVAALTIDDTGDASPALETGTTLENYRDTWRFALGTNLHIHDKAMLRLGVGFEQTPTINAERDVRLPDANRYAVSIGGHYEPTKIVSIDAGYTHYFIQSIYVNKTDQIQINQVNILATGKANADLVGGQIVVKLD